MEISFPSIALSMESSARTGNFRSPRLRRGLVHLGALDPFGKLDGLYIKRPEASKTLKPYIM
jgi:hypothetical protein